MQPKLTFANVIQPKIHYMNQLKNEMLQLQNSCTVNALISAHGRLDFLCALGWALIRDGR